MEIEGGVERGRVEERRGEVVLNEVVMAAGWLTGLAGLLRVVRSVGPEGEPRCNERRKHLVECVWLQPLCTILRGRSGAGQRSLFRHVPDDSGLFLCIYLVVAVRHREAHRCCLFWETSPPTPSLSLYQTHHNPTTTTTTIIHNPPPPKTTVVTPRDTHSLALSSTPSLQCRKIKTSSVPSNGPEKYLLPPSSSLQNLSIHCMLTFTSNRPWLASPATKTITIATCTPAFPNPRRP